MLAADQFGWFAINNIPGVRNPMDFNIIKKKMLTKEYKSAPEFAADVRLVFTNCYQYSDQNPEKVAKCRELNHLFELTYYDNIQSESQCTSKGSITGKSTDNDIFSIEHDDPNKKDASPREPTNADELDNDNGGGVNKKETFGCNSCDKSFSTKYSLMRHVHTTHEKKKPFGCSLCDRQFSQKVNMERHKNLVHTQQIED